MGKKSRDKGYRMENQTRLILNASEIPTIRVPLSGGGSIKGDLILWPDTNIKKTAECKIRSTGFKTLYAFLENDDMAFIRSDNNETLAIMPMRLFLDFAKAYAEVNK